MKRLIVVLVVLLAAPLAAQEVCVDATYCHTSTAAQVAAQAERKATHNTTVCSHAGLAASCSQAEYDAACAELECGGETVYAATANGTRQFFRDRVAELLEADSEARLQQIRNRGDDYYRSLDDAGIASTCVSWGLTSTCTQP